MITYFHRTTNQPVEATQWQHPGTWMATMQPVNTGDWLVRFPAGNEEILNPEEFSSQYQASIEGKQEYWAKLGWYT